MAITLRKLAHDCSWPKCNLIRNYEVVVDGNTVGRYCEAHARKKAEDLRKAFSTKRKPAKKKAKK